MHSGFCPFQRPDDTQTLELVLDILYPVEQEKEATVSLLVYLTLPLVKLSCGQVSETWKYKFT